MRIPFGSAVVSGTIKTDGDDYFLMQQNPCDTAVHVQVRLFGADGLGDCAADARSSLSLHAELRSPAFHNVRTQFHGSACSEPISIQVPPHSELGVVHLTPVIFPAGVRDVRYAPERYVLEIRVTPDR
jgi:hypothetical protein